MVLRALDRRTTRLLLLLALTVIYYAVPWQSIPPVGALVGLPFLLLYTVIVPGAALDRFLVRGERDILGTITSWAFLGFAVVLLYAFVWALSGVSLPFFANALPLVVVALGLAAPVRPPGANPVRGASPEGMSRSRERRLAVSYAVFTAIIGVLVLWTGPPVDYGKDTLDYVAYTDEVVASGEPFPNTSFYLDPGPNGADLRKGLLHALYGYYKWYLGVDTLTLFRALGAVLLMLVMLAVYTAGYAFFGNRLVAVLAGVLFVIGFDGGIRSDLIRSFFYPNRFAIGYLLLFLVAALDFLRRPRSRPLVLCSVYAFAAAAVHIQYTVLLGFVVLTILVWKTCFDTGTLRDHALRSIATGVAAFMGMLPYAAYRYWTAYQAGGASELHRQVQGAVFVTDRLFIANPYYVWQSMGLLGVAALLAIVPLWKRRRQYPALGYLMASLLTLVLIQFNPLLMPAVYGAITYLVFRLGIICPVYLLSAYFLVAASRPVRPGETWGRLRRFALALMLVAVATGLAPVFGTNTFSPEEIASERARSYLRWSGGLEMLNELPDGTVIASDPVTSYCITAFTPHHVVCTFDQHAPPNDLLSRARTTAARDISSPFTSASDKAYQAADHRVTHVVVNEDLGLRELTDYWTVSEQSAPLVLGRMRSLDAMFEEVGYADGLRVYRWNGKSPRHVERIRNPLLRRILPSEAARRGEVAGLARLEAAQITGLDSVPPGESIEVTLFWRRDRALSLDKYIVAVRFDRVDLELPFGGKPFPKITRKIKEKLVGARYRFRQDHKIVDGFFDPDVWPPDSYVVDRTTVQVPANAAEGRYAVRAKLLTTSTWPNYQLRDFLYDDDVYHGVEIGEITVGRPK
jgi:hypothetical protein